MRELVDVDFPQTGRIRVVMDNLSAHTPGSLYAAFPASEAHRLLGRLVFHFTPKHASWLNMVEIKIEILKGRCLDRRIATREGLEREIAAWERERNAVDVRITWMFPTENACAKTGCAYPSCLDARPPWRQRRPGGLAAKRLNRVACSAGWPASARPPGGCARPARVRRP